MTPPAPRLLNQDEIAKLVDYQIDCQGDECVSLYMPCHPSEAERVEDFIRFKNLTGVAKSRLLARAASEADAEQILGPAHVPQTDHWFSQNRGQGLACFWSRDFERIFFTPLSFPETVIVNRRFHIRPLLGLMWANARYFILALTHESARLYEATESSIREICFRDADLFGNDSPFRQPMEASRGASIARSAMPYGMGGQSEPSTTNIVKYFQSVDRIVTTTLSGQQSPLVLACLGYLASIYGMVNNYRRLLRAKVPGNPERWSRNELRDHAGLMVEPHFRQQVQAAWRRFQLALPQGGASYCMPEIARAADAGRVQSLFVNTTDQRWGVIQPERQTVELMNSVRLDREELLEFTAWRTLRGGGDVYAVESFPTFDSPILPDSPIAAIFHEAPDSTSI